MDGVEKIEANEMNGLFGFGFTGSSTTTTGDSVLNDPGMFVCPWFYFLLSLLTHFFVWQQ
jgi:hypothetical protein